VRTSLENDPCIKRSDNSYNATCDAIVLWGCWVRMLAVQHIYFIVAGLVLLPIVFFLHRKSPVFLLPSPVASLCLSVHCSI
jgi:hypothetical protein